MKTINALVVAAFATLTAASYGSFSYSTGFEASEGFSLGSIGGQNGYSLFPVGAENVNISDANPLGGTQHLRIGRDPNATPGQFAGAQSSIFDTTGLDIFSFSADFSISALGGGSYDFVGYDSVNTALAFQVSFLFTGDIILVDNSGWEITGATWTPGDTLNFSTVHNFADGTASYSLNGTEFYSASTLSGASGISYFALLSDNTQMGDVGDFDNINFAGEAVPEPMTMSVLGLGAAALAFRRRKRS